MSNDKKLDFVSALGYALGYVGGGTLFTFCVLMTVRPTTFGLTNEREAARRSFLIVAAWWAAFSLPLLFWVRERVFDTAPAVKLSAQVKAAWCDLRQTFGEMRALRAVVLFLMGYWLYIDGVGTVIKMAVDYGAVLGFEPRHLVRAILITQFVGFPAALAFGWMGERFGAKNGILIGLQSISVHVFGDTSCDLLRSFAL